MSIYEIKMNLEITEISKIEALKNKPIKGEDGSYKINISETEAISIDVCEQRVLELSYEAIRDELSHHFSEISKKKPVSRPKGDR